MGGQLGRAQLNDDTSYLIVGGMGGIGRSLCEWMVERGAKHLIVMSRSATVDDFLSELPCNVRAVGCDIANEAQLTEALVSCVDMPPIRGVIQAAMVLQVSEDSHMFPASV